MYLRNQCLPRGNVSWTLYWTSGRTGTLPPETYNKDQSSVGVVNVYDRCIVQIELFECILCQIFNELVENKDLYRTQRRLLKMFGNKKFLFFYLKDFVFSKYL